MKLCTHGPRVRPCILLLHPPSCLIFLESPLNRIRFRVPKPGLTRLAGKSGCFLPVK